MEYLYESNCNFVTFLTFLLFAFSNKTIIHESNINGFSAIRNKIAWVDGFFWSEHGNKIVDIEME